MAKTQVKQAVNKPEFVEDEVVAVAVEVEQPVPQPITLIDNQVANNTLLELEDYANAMRPGLYVRPVEGAKLQLKLYRVIERLFNRFSNEDFQATMPVVLNWFKEHSNGVTGDAYLFRFTPEWTATPQERDAFIRLAKLLQLTADPKARTQILSNMNLDYYLETGLSEAGRERLLAFYGQ